MFAFFFFFLLKNILFILESWSLRSCHASQTYQRSTDTKFLNEGSCRRVPGWKRVGAPFLIKNKNISFSYKKEKNRKLRLCVRAVNCTFFPILFFSSAVNVYLFFFFSFEICDSHTNKLNVDWITTDTHILFLSSWLIKSNRACVGCQLSTRFST